MLDSGTVDGEGIRMAGYEQTHPNAVMVTEPIVSTTLIAIAKDPAIQLETWEDLQDTNYRVDYYRGIAPAERILPNVVKAENLSAVSEPVQAFKKLVAGRVDVYVDLDGTIMALLQLPEFQNSGIRVLDVKEEIFNYPYLHKRHADLAPKLAEALKQMKAEGLFEQYMQQAQQEFAQQ
jgi:ABC-type amino acid transport substrate-binding protein